MTVPFDRVIWDAQACADYLGKEVKVFYRMQYLPGFPPRLQIPGHPRWQAKAVTDWALGITQESRKETVSA